MVEMLHIDCMDYMSTLPDKAFELAIVDPPYGIGAAKEKPHNGWADWGIKEWDNEPPPPEFFVELMRVSKNQIVWGANHFISTMPLDTSCWIIWDKGQRNFSLADGEMAWASFDSAMRIFDLSRGRANSEDKIHPTQKPVALYRWLLHNYAKPGDRILDTHGGSGSSAIACHQMGFDMIWMEKDKDYYEAACKRFGEQTAQEQLFAVTK